MVDNLKDKNTILKQASKQASKQAGIDLSWDGKLVNIANSICARYDNGICRWKNVSTGVLVCLEDWQK